MKSDIELKNILNLDSAKKTILLALGFKVVNTIQDVVRYLTEDIEPNLTESELERLCVLIMESDL